MNFHSCVSSAYEFLHFMFWAFWVTHVFFGAFEIFAHYTRLHSVFYTMNLGCEFVQSLFKRSRIWPGAELDVCSCVLPILSTTSHLDDNDIEYAAQVFACMQFAKFSLSSRLNTLLIEKNIWILNGNCKESRRLYNWMKNIFLKNRHRRTKTVERN